MGVFLTPINIKPTIMVFWTPSYCDWYECHKLRLLYKWIWLIYFPICAHKYFSDHNLAIKGHCSQLCASFTSIYIYQISAINNMEIHRFLFAVSFLLCDNKTHLWVSYLTHYFTGVWIIHHKFSLIDNQKSWFTILTFLVWFINLFLPSSRKMIGNYNSLFCISVSASLFWPSYIWWSKIKIG